MGRPDIMIRLPKKLALDIKKTNPGLSYAKIFSTYHHKVQQFNNFELKLNKVGEFIYGKNSWKKFKKK